MERKTFSIVREGKTYELTPDELMEAYFVQQENFNIDDVVNNADTDFMLDLFPDATDEECDVIINASENESVIKQIATVYESKKDNDNSWYDCLRNAVREVLECLLNNVES